MKLQEIVLTESFKNLFSADDKEKWVDEVWQTLQDSYKSIGGIKGSGFKNKNDMVKNIPMWKIWTENGEVMVVVMYKDKGGRKSVAAGTDGSSKAKLVLLDIIKNDFKRSFGERSGPLLRFINKNMPELVKKYAIETNKVSDIIGKEIKIVDKYNYTRSINGVEIPKMLMGTPGKTIK